jgi:hypothetical protein
MMRALSVLLFLFAAGLFLAASIYQLKAARSYRRATNALGEIAAFLMLERDPNDG